MLGYASSLEVGGARSAQAAHGFCVNDGWTMCRGKCGEELPESARCVPGIAHVGLVLAYQQQRSLQDAEDTSRRGEAELPHEADKLSDSLHRLCLVAVLRRLIPDAAAGGGGGGCSRFITIACLSQAAADRYPHASSKARKVCCPLAVLCERGEAPSLSTAK